MKTSIIVLISAMMFSLGAATQMSAIYNTYFRTNTEIRIETVQTKTNLNFDETFSSEEVDYYILAKDITLPKVIVIAKRITVLQKIPDETSSDSDHIRVYTGKLTSKIKPLETKNIASNIQETIKSFKMDNDTNREQIELEEFCSNNPELNPEIIYRI